jgi:hypothetical protein
MAKMEELMLKVSENLILRRIFGPRRDEMAGGCKKFQYEDIHNLYSSQNIIRMIERGAKYVVCMGRREEKRREEKRREEKRREENH